jgi:hypothetical protein
MPVLTKRPSSIVHGIEGGVRLRMIAVWLSLATLAAPQLFWAAYPHLGAFSKCHFSRRPGIGLKIEQMIKMEV